jgi:hypothetical protein
VYNNLTDSELLNIQPTTELEAELTNRIEEYFIKQRESNEVLEKLRDALSKVMTEIHRCADFGIIEIKPKFRKLCEEVVCAVDELVVYEYPQLPNGELANNSSSFRAGGKA